MATYRDAAAAGYTLLLQQYQTPEVFSGNFWFGGNTLRTCLAYLLAAGKTDTDQILVYAYQKVYLVERDKPGWWRDDYAWWGNAFVAARNFRGALGYQSSQYDDFFRDLLSAAEYCWNMLDENWRDTPYTAEGDNAAGSAPIIGGTANTFDSPPMSGRNCVTNEGFYLLSMGLSTQGAQYQQRAGQMMQWFGQWLKLPADQGLLNDKGLVLERPTGNQTDPAWYWTGDQGLYMDICVRYMPNSSMAQSLANAVLQYMADGDGVIHENTLTGALVQFTADYATGKGIFMRALANYSRLNGDLFSRNILQNANAVWANRLAGNQFTYNWNPSVPGHEEKVLPPDKSETLNNLIMQTAGLEALTATLSFAGDREAGSL